MNRRTKQLIGSGRKRIVYDLGNGYVLKVAKSKAGIRSNQIEFIMYRSSRFAPVRHHLAKIVRCGRTWLVMKKYTRPFPLTPKYMLKYKSLKAKFRKYGVIPYDMYSMTHRGPSTTNLRLNRKGRVIVIDYGNFKFQ